MCKRVFGWTRSPIQQMQIAQHVDNSLILSKTIANTFSSTEREGELGHKHGWRSS